MQTPLSDQNAQEGFVDLAAATSSARLALVGAEPLSWRVADRELLWHGDPVHWAGRAPILFPVVGASAGGIVRIGGAMHAMPQHGFARDMPFTLVERDESSARLRLVDSQATRVHYPFAFQLDVVASLGRDTLSLAFEVWNRDLRDMPYAVGFHPAFPWPLDGGGREGHAVAFEREERPEVPAITAGALIGATSRPISMAGRLLRLDPSLFAHNALVFLNARSRSLGFVAPSGAAITLTVEDFPHFALWTKPTAPFLSLEAWTGHADPEGFAGELVERPSMRALAGGGRARHVATMRWRPGGASPGSDHPF